jgi:NADH dehydrogenase
MMKCISEPDANSIGTQHVVSADIVILGAGYGGLHVAQRLMRLLADDHHADGAPWSILIVDRQPHHQLTTELPRIIGNEVADRDLDIPLDQLLSERKDQFLQAEILAIHPSPNSQPGAIETSAGRIEYRYLIVALGSVSNDFGVPGVRQYMRPFLTTEDARDLRIAVSRSIQDAARYEFDQMDAEQDELRRRMTVLIGGAGATGVEVAGELAEFMEEQWQSAWRVAGEPAHYRLPKPHIILVGAAPTVLPGWSGRTSQAVADALRELGVELRLNAPITQAEPGRVRLKSGEWIAADTLVLNLTPQTRQVLSAQRNRLAAAEVPIEVSGEMRAAVQQAIAESFVAGRQTPEASGVWAARVSLPSSSIRCYNAAVRPIRSSFHRHLAIRLLA